MAYTVFVSHTAADLELARRIFERAHQAGIRAYLHEDEIAPGNPVSKKVLRRLDSADAVVALLTPAGATSAYVHQEIGAAFAFDKRVLALVDPGVPRESLAMLWEIEHLPLMRESDAALYQLVTALQKAKESQEKWLWGFGGLVLGAVVWSRLSKPATKSSTENE